MTNKFLYFAYGSNLLAQRLHLNNPTAVRKSVAKLQDYHLGFNEPFSKRWNGFPATLVPKKGACVWGAVWEIDNSNLPDLDRQEGVEDNIYFTVQVQVETPKGEKFKCRSYQLCSTSTDTNPSSEKKPSQVYLEVIIQGALETGLPQEYIEYLKTIPHNGYNGDVEVPIKIQLTQRKSLQGNENNKY